MFLPNVPGAMFIPGATSIQESRVGGNEGGGEVTPTSISIFDSYDIKTL